MVGFFFLHPDLHYMSNLTSKVAEIARSTTVVVHTWICQPKKKELSLLKRQTCFGPQRLRQKLNVGNRLGVFHSQIFTYTQRHLLNTCLLRTSVSFTMWPPSPVNLVSMMLVISPSGLARYHCKWPIERITLELQSAYQHLGS